MWKRKLTKSSLGNKMKVLAYFLIAEKRKNYNGSLKGKNSLVTIAS